MRGYSDNWYIFRYMRKLFGIEKPLALPLGKWDEWEKNFKKQKPIVFFLTETVPDLIDTLTRYIPTPIDNIKYYYRNRFIRKTHVLPTGLKPGQYYDLEERILHGLMQSLVDYVEIELAYKSKWCNTDSNKTAKWKNGRCRQLGLDYLNWEMSLDNPKLDINEAAPGQAQEARDIKALYDWWTIHRPARPDPYVTSGWSDLCENKLNGGMKILEDGPPEFEIAKTESLKTLRKIEESYYEEDQAMLNLLIKIRRGLWA